MEVTRVGKGRILGVLLCIVGILVAGAHLYIGYWIGTHPNLAFALPVTAGVLVVCALAVWLGWIMATTKEVQSPPPEPEKKEEQKQPGASS
jgi:zinc transporter ZupT